MHESHLRQAVRLPHAYTAEHLMRMRKARKENRTVHECPTFARLDAGDGCEEVAWVDHFQLALSHSLAHLPQLAGQVLGTAQAACWGCTPVCDSQSSTLIQHYIHAHRPINQVHCSGLSMMLLSSLHCLGISRITRIILRKALQDGQRQFMQLLL